MNEFEKNMEDIFDIEVESTDIEPVKNLKHRNLFQRRKRKIIKIKTTNILEHNYTPLTRVRRR